jgi:NAD-dependent dihydropyrimidine dehydrogenase PreA subunit
MKEAIGSLKYNLSLFNNAKKTYRRLQKHLNTMPVGFPRTFTGIELRLLQYLFSLREAQAALYLDYRFETLDSIYTRVDQKQFSKDEFRALLDEMERRGSIFGMYTKKEKTYALHPLIVGVLEMQHWHLTAGLFLDIRKYVTQRYLTEYLTTPVPQMRVIPVGESITPDNTIATYDEIRDIVDQAEDKIGIIDCLCKKGKDLLGDPCKVTDRREVCMFFRDFYDKANHYKWEFGRKISKKEAFEILDQNEKDGLVLMPSTSREPEFVCSCCECCCGVMEMIHTVPRPVDFVASNYYAAVDPASCNGCGRCYKRCNMGAVVMDASGKKAVAIDARRCIGCGLCVTTCKCGSLKLKKKSVEFVPPKDHEELYEHIMKNRKSGPERLLTAGMAMMGVKTVSK